MNTKLLVYEEGYYHVMTLYGRYLNIVQYKSIARELKADVFQVLLNKETVITFLPSPLDLESI